VRRLVIFLVVVVGLVLIGDRLALSAASANLRERVGDAVHHTGETRGSITSFPFLGRLLMNGSIPRVDVAVDGVAAGPVVLGRVAADLRGVTIDRTELLTHRRVRLTSLKSGTVTAEITEAELSRALSSTVHLLPGKASLDAADLRATASVAVHAGRVTLTARGLPALSFVVPRAPLLPCETDRADVVQGKLRLSCTIDHLPPELANVDLLSLLAK
jgi:hypothetical protein